MGSLTSRPKILPVQQPEVITFTTAPTPTPVATTVAAAPAPTDTTSTDTPTSDDTATAHRGANLQERSRGLLSTVLTGFDGVLNNTNGAAPQRKSLLGE